MDNKVPEISSQPMKNLSRKTIMIVEDDEAIGHLLVQALQDEFGCKVILVTDGLQALQVVKDITPNLFLLDYLLPSINGLELYDRLQAQDTLVHTPKVLMSANLPQLAAEQRHLMALKKPFDIDDLFSLVERMLTPPASCTN
ncbi:MAG: hypothetical protein NVS2B12_12320 [Ktedonobacteraceae bacterium]